MAAAIGAHDWALTALGPIAGWTDRLRLMVETVLASPHVASLVCGPERILIYNDAAARLYGARHPSALGRALPEAFPAGWATVAPLYARAFAGETVQVTEQPLDTRGEGRSSDVCSATLIPVRDAAGAVIAVYMTGQVGSRSRAEATMRESEAKYRTVFDAIDEGYLLAEVVFDDGGRPADILFLEANPAAVRLAGREFAGRRLREINLGYEDHWLEIHGRVALTGEPLHAERYAAPHGRWFEFHASRVGPPGSHRVAVVFQDTTERRQAEAALRESEDRQAFLLRLGEALQPLTDAEDIRLAAATMLGQHLRASRVAYAENVGGEHFEVARNYVAGATEAAGRHPHADYRLGIVAELKAGRTRIHQDIRHDPRLSDEERRAHLAAGVGASLNLPLVREGQLVAFLEVSYAVPHDFRPSEIELVREVAAHIWASIERARAEAALRESEGRLRALVEGVPQVVWRAVGDGHWTWASQRWAAFTGQPEAESHGHGWLAPVHPADREAVLAAWRDAAGAGDGFRAEYRLRHAREGRWRWVESQATPLRDGAGGVEWLGTTTDVEELRVAQEQRILIEELHHRGRNLLAVVGGLAQQTLATSCSPEEFGLRFEQRLGALGRVQGLLSRQLAPSVTIGELLRLELAAHGAEQGSQGRVRLGGPELVLPARAVQLLALALHELLTNAVKHGALAAPGGRLGIAWSEQPGLGKARWLRLDWTESGVAMPGAPSRRGFGLDLIETSLPYELDAETRLVFGPDGLSCRIALPLEEWPGAAAAGIG